MRTTQYGYELPDLTRTIDILIGVIFSGLATFWWNRRIQISTTIRKNPFFVMFGLFQLFLVWIYFNTDIAVSLHIMLLFELLASITILLDKEIPERILTKLKPIKNR